MSSLTTLPFDKYFSCCRTRRTSCIQAMLLHAMKDRHLLGVNAIPQGSFILKRKMMYYVREKKLERYRVCQSKGKGGVTGIGGE